MRKILLLAPALLLHSCTIDENGEADFTILWVLILVFIVVSVIAVIFSNKQDTAYKEKLKAQGIDPALLVNTVGTYVGGHPDIDNQVEMVIFQKSGPELLICNRNMGLNTLDKYGSIPLAHVEAITVEDESTIEKKVTLGRILLVGVFALAWKKKKKNELAFVTITWKAGRFTHETVFSFPSMQLANTHRNQLLKLCTDETLSASFERNNAPVIPQRNPAPSNDSVADELMKMKKLLDEGIITQDEFDQQKRRLLGL